MHALWLSLDLHTWCVRAAMCVCVCVCVCLCVGGALRLADVWRGEEERDGDGGIEEEEEAEGGEV